MIQKSGFVSYESSQNFSRNKEKRNDKMAQFRIISIHKEVFTII
jgi:hypothetical protein